jgi:hypothetical protein
MMGPMKMLMAIILVMGTGAAFAQDSTPTPGVAGPAAKKGHKAPVKAAPEAGKPVTVTTTTDLGKLRRDCMRVFNLDDSGKNVKGGDKNQVVFDYKSQTPLWQLRKVDFGDTVTFHVVNFDSGVTIQILAQVVQPDLSAVASMVSSMKNAQGVTLTSANPVTQGADPGVTVNHVSSVPTLATGKYILYSMIVNDGSGPTTISNFYKVRVKGAIFESSVGLMGVFDGLSSPFTITQTTPAIFAHLEFIPELFTIQDLSVAGTVGLGTNGSQNLGYFFGLSFLYGSDQRLVLSGGTSLWADRTYPTLAVSFAGF